MICILPDLLNMSILYSFIFSLIKIVISGLMSRRFEHRYMIHCFSTQLKKCLLFIILFQACYCSILDKLLQFIYGKKCSCCWSFACNCIEIKRNIVFTILEILLQIVLLYYNLKSFISL